MSTECECRGFACKARIDSGKQPLCEATANHTEGPWEIEECVNGIEIMDETLCITIAAVRDRPTTATTKANAALIKAAPQLLAALRAVYRAPGNINDRTMRKIESALNEALP